MQPIKVAIVGGGISGLSTAYFLSEQTKDTPIEITVFDDQAQLGGVIQTQKTALSLCEFGPDAFLTEKPQALALCKALGLEDQIISTSKEHRRSFVAKGNRLIPVPGGWFMIAPKDLSSLFATQMFSWPGKLRMAMELVIPASKNKADESVSDFVKRRFGQEALDRIGQPMIGGIYTADPAKLSLLATFPRLKQMEQEQGSLIRALWKRSRQSAVATRSSKEASGPRYGLFATLKGGLGTLIQRLAEVLKERNVLVKAQGVESIERRDQGWALTLADGGECWVDAVCLAIPAPRAADVCKKEIPQLQSLLSDISYASVATVNLVYRREAIQHALNGFGFVVPAVEHRNLVGCSFSSIKFEGRAESEHVLLRAFVGGAYHDHVLRQTDDALCQNVQADLNILLGIQESPQEITIKRWQNAMPQYAVGHLDRLNQIEQVTKQVKGLYLTGNAYRGIGIPDCIRQAEMTATALWQDVAKKNTFDKQSQ